MNSATRYVAEPLSAAPSGPGLSRRSAGVQSSAIRDLLALTERPDIVSLAGGLPDARALPVEWLGECLSAALATPGALQYSTTEGVPALRELIAAWESRACGRPVSPNDVVVTAGAQQALDLIGKTLLDPDDIVVVENPAYVGALQAFQLAGARVVTVPQDADGLDVGELARQLRNGLRPRLLYTTPTFHNPGGTTLAATRRELLVELAARYRFHLVEDDAYRRLHFETPPPAPIAAHHAGVIRLGTFSKILSPGLRVGWIVAGVPQRAAFVRVKQATDLHTSTLGQLAVLHAARDAARLDVHVDRIRALYRSRAACLVKRLDDTFGNRIEVRAPQGGMFSWVRFADGTRADQLLPAALRAGVAFVPGTAFGPGDANLHAARLCFASIAEDQLDEAVRRLALAHAEVATAPSR